MFVWILSPDLKSLIFSICVAFSTKDAILLCTMETCSKRGSNLKLLMLWKMWSCVLAEEVCAAWGNDNLEAPFSMGLVYE